MVMAMKVLCAALVVGTAAATSSSDGSQGAANPIRRVVNLLQRMQKKVIEEGKRDAEIYQKFACYCKTGARDLERSISAAQSKSPQVTSALDAAKAKKTQLMADLKNHQGDRADALDALAQASALRKKETTTFAKDSDDLTTNIKALGSAIAAISKGVGAGFLQTSTASAVRQMAINMDGLSGGDRNRISAFLSEGQAESMGSDYAPASGEILGILKQMQDTMEGDFTAVRKAEKEAIASFEGLSAAKKTEASVNTKAIEEKTGRLGKVGVQIEDLKEDLQGTAASYDEDKTFLANLDKSCAGKQRDWEAVQKTRADELVALADTIKIINDDDALQLFKQTLPSPSLLQAKVATKEMRSKALVTLLTVKDPRLDLIALAIRGKKVSFDKVLVMLDHMSAILQEEQVSDDKKKVYCESEIDKTEDEHKELHLDTADLEKTAEEVQADIETLAEEVAALTASIKALDTSVADATATRKAENSEYQSTMAADTAANELLKVAQNRLYQFYNPRLYKAPPQKELSAQQRIAVDMGSEAAPTDAPSGIAGTGIVALVQERSQELRASGVEAPPPPPEAVGPYQKKGQESAGVLAMMKLLIEDLEKEMTEVKTEERDSQADYDKYISDSAVKRRMDSKSLEEKMSRTADAEVSLQRTKRETKSKKADDYATALVLRDLHMDCDWLLSNFDVRKEARAGESDALAKAKAVLSGADYSLVQLSSSRKRLRGKHHHQ